MLRHEACAMVMLKDHIAFLSVDAWCRSQYYEYLTMELLEPSIASTLMNDKFFDIDIATRLANQLVSSHAQSSHYVKLNVCADRRSIVQA